MTLRSEARNQISGYSPNKQFIQGAVKRAMEGTRYVELHQTIMELHMNLLSEKMFVVRTELRCSNFWFVPGVRRCYSTGRFECVTSRDRTKTAEGGI